jgi:hypothetical protein
VQKDASLAGSRPGLSLLASYPRYVQLLPRVLHQLNRVKASLLGLGGTGPTEKEWARYWIEDPNLRLYGTAPLVCSSVACRSADLQTQALDYPSMMYGQVTRAVGMTTTGWALSHSSMFMKNSSFHTNSNYGSIFSGHKVSCRNSKLQDHLFVQQFPISEMSSNLHLALQLIFPSWLGAISVSHLSNQTIVSYERMIVGRLFLLS